MINLLTKTPEQKIMNDLTAESTSSPDVLELERVFKAPSERVFDAFASEAALKQWFGPGYCAVLWANVSFKEGGDYHLRLMVEDNGEIDLVGKYRKVAGVDQFFCISRRGQSPRYPQPSGADDNRHLL